MNWKSDRMGSALPILFVLFLCLMLSSPLLAQSEAPVPSSTPFPVLGKQVEIRGWEKGKLNWVLRAAEIKFDKEGNQAVCQGGIELVVYSEDGAIRSTLKARSAEIDLERKNFRFFDSVEVVSRDGDRIVTDELIYRDRVKMLETKSTTQVFFNGNTLECEGLTSDIDFEHPEFYRIIRGYFRIGSK
ncbi:MAG: LPS export ABC transporter periplasmic protein LptC [Atribacterota bacterium]|nr:LPS export ABC transporter periplasmic protein LptC [Atribacterota bacterium]